MKTITQGKLKGNMTKLLLYLEEESNNRKSIRMI